MWAITALKRAVEASSQKTKDRAAPIIAVFDDTEEANEKLPDLGWAGCCAMSIVNSNKPHETRSPTTTTGATRAMMADTDSRAGVATIAVAGDVAVTITTRQNRSM